MTQRVTIRRLSTRNAPDGSWSVGDACSVPVDEARAAIAAGQAELAPGQELPPVSGGESAVTPDKGVGA